MSLTGLFLLFVLVAFTQVAQTNSDADLDDDEFFGEAPPPQEQQVRPTANVKVETPQQTAMRAQEKKQTQQQQQDEFDDDEFHREPAAPSAQSKKGRPAGQQASEGKAAAPKDDLISRARKWWVETVALTFFLVYCVNFWLGSSKNEKIVTRWGLLYKQLLLDNFAKVGSEAPITKLSQSNFSIIATGRTNCVGMHATFNLKNRQDLVSVLLGILYPKKDRLTIDIALENDAQMMVFALLPLRYERTLKDDERFKDVREFAKRRKVPESVGLPPSYSVFSDSNEILEKMLDSGLIGVLQQDERFFEFIHVSDQCTTSTKYKKLLRIELNLPEVEKMEELSNALQYSLALIDLVAHADLSPSSQAKAKHIRDLVIKQQKKEEEKEELEKQQEARAAKEEERLKNLSPEQKRKEEEKAKKKEMKKKSKVMVKKYKM